jgi:hypothetical protein
VSGGRCWYRAAWYPDLESAGVVYAAIELYLTRRPTPPDVSGYRLVADNKPWVVVLTDDEPGRVSPTATDLIEHLLGQRGAVRAELDGGVLDVLYADWSTKRGSGPPIVERGRNEAAVYQSRGPEASSA